MKKFPGQHVYEIYESVLGKPIAVILGLLFFSYAIFYAGTNLREFAEIMKAYSFPFTPLYLTITCVLIVTAIFNYFGIECMVRVSVIFFVPIAIGVVLILALAAPTYDAYLLRPFWGYGITNTVFTGILRSSAYSEILALTVIIKSLQGFKNFKKAGFLSLALSGIVLMISMMLYIMSFGYTLGQEKLSAFFELSRIIYISRFFQRVESVFLFIWVISSVITVAAAVYIALSTYCKVFRLKNHRPLIYPVEFLVFTVAILPDNVMQLMDINIQITRKYSLFLLYLVPVLVLIISAVFKKKGGSVSGKDA